MYRATDEELMARIQAGDEASFAELFERYDALLYGFLLRRTRDPERAGELFQETWLNVHRGRRTWREGHPFRPWLFGIALNAMRDADRRSGRRVRTVALSPDSGAQRSSARTGPGRPELRMTLEDAVHALPDTLREAFLLGAVLGFDHREVARQLGITPANARARISRARAKLRALLRPL